MDLQIYIGYDARSRAAWQVCAGSMQAHVGDYPVAVSAIGRQQLEQQGLYTRPTEIRGARRWDAISGEYCSTDFSLARFWVPHLAGRVGWALFCDCDFLWRADVRGILNHADPRCAVMVVRHHHVPMEAAKMDGQAQTRYRRKNWSSLMLWNLGHAGNQRLSAWCLNNRGKHELHALCWLRDDEIGELPEAWNWLEGWSDPAIEPKAVHFTRGLPDLPGYENSAYADEWRRYLIPTERAA